MRVLYIHQYFKVPTEPGATRSYWLAKELVKNGHNVTMLTSSSDQKTLIKRKNVEGIDVIYIKNAYDNKMSIGQRIWSFTRFMLYSTWIGLRQRKVDLVYATSTPLTVAFPAILIKWLKGIKYIFEVRDLWPEVPIQMGAIKNRLLIRALYELERFIYKSAVHIVALSPGMYDGILKRGISSEKVTLIPNMAKKDEFYNRPKDLQVAKEFNINVSKFNVIHFGAMGVANGLEYIVNAAICLKKRGDHQIHFIFLGGGKFEEKLKTICAQENLSNVSVLGKFPMKTVSEIVNICDCSIVSFANIPILYTNSPNKLFDSLSAGKPIIVNSAGWTKVLVEENNCGVFVDPENPEALADALILMAQRPEKVSEMGKNSRRLAEEVYDKSILCRVFMRVIQRYGMDSDLE